MHFTAWTKRRNGKVIEKKQITQLKGSHTTKACYLRRVKTFYEVSLRWISFCFGMQTVYPLDGGVTYLWAGFYGMGWRKEIGGREPDMDGYGWMDGWVL
jgi:hypothetical protein